MRSRTKGVRHTDRNQRQASPHPSGLGIWKALRWPHWRAPGGSERKRAASWLMILWIRKLPSKLGNFEVCRHFCCYFKPKQKKPSKKAASEFASEQKIKVKGPEGRSYETQKNNGTDGLWWLCEPFLAAVVSVKKCAFIIRWTVILQRNTARRSLVLGGPGHECFVLRVGIRIKFLINYSSNFSWTHYPLSLLL